jgi:eukaryotic-like serine/threonine-protein kinase
LSTTLSEPTPSEWHGAPAAGNSDGLPEQYRRLVQSSEFGWTSHHRKLRRLGKGGQGVVFLAERRGTDGFRLPVALKIFSPEPYRDADSYRADMARVAQTAVRVALIQHDNLVAVHDFIEEDGIRVMEMEWLDGFDLRDLLTLRMLELTRARLSPEQCAHVGNVILAPGPLQPRLKPGVAIHILRDCLRGVAALHREGIVHGDIKPSNILLKRTGNAKVIDIGSAVDLRQSCARQLWSPAYAAPEVLRGAPSTPLSDLASIGYVLIEMLAGQSPFEGLTTYAELQAAKETLEQRLPTLLPREVAGNELLLNLCRRLIALDPNNRFSGAHAAELGRKGAAAFHRQLVKSDLASEYENDLRVWLAGLGDGYVPAVAG